ncbi:E3 ubiquitin-protein ligase TRIM71-like [Saccostrea cucullata]|uniref:E3 ubiquitin-protein ligase TRIM71-like n=1 Tax=Saccostrea cuccullata TaxID=36930 RepID=UPI002ED18C1C
MDPEIRAQELIRCDLCKTEIVLVLCDTCHFKLCKDCIIEHTTFGDSLKKHEIVKFTVRKSIPLYPFCTVHNKEHCEMYCNQCEIPVCIACIASDQHSGHKFLKILDVLEETKQKIIKEKNELKDSIYPKYEQIVSDAENTIQQFENECEGLSAAITKHGEEWHREIDKVVTKLIAKVEELKTNQLQLLQKHLDEIKKIISEIRDEINSIDDVLDSRDFSKLTDFTLNVDKYRKFPRPIVLPSPKLITPMKISGDELCSLFGNLSLGKRHEITQKLSEAVSSPAAKLLLDEPEIIATINTRYRINLTNVAYLNDEEIWTSGEENTMKLFHINRDSPIISIRTKSRNRPFDIAVTRDGNLIYADFSEGTVNIVKKEGTDIESIIRLQDWKPLNICSTSLGDLLVVLESINKKQSKVVRFSGSTEKNTIQYDDKGNPLYSYGNTKCICENKNLDICVADFRADAVIVVSEAGKLRFKYVPHITTSKNQLFSPRGITTDSQSHILTADITINCVHIIDQDGQFICHIDCGLNSPWGLCVDTKNNLFVAEFRDKQVKKIKYLKES